MTREVGEPVEATAPHAVSWVGVVVPGSWPSRAADRLPVGLAEALDAVPGVRPVLLRPVGRSSTDVGLVLAGTVPMRTWLREVAADDTPAALEALRDEAVVAALTNGRDPGLGRSTGQPLVLVCTNGARDACCAREGRPAADLLLERVGRARPRRFGRARTPAAVWESSHLGGHRFAPTAVVLPHGVVLGGLGPGPEALADAVDGVLAGRTVLEGYRGRSTYRAHEQAAETAVRRHLGLIGVNAGPDDVAVDGSEPAADPRGPEAGETDSHEPSDVIVEATGWAHRVFVRHSGGRTFRVLVARTVTEVARPTSCGADPGRVVVWETEVDSDSSPGIYVSG